MKKNGQKWKSEQNSKINKNDICNGQNWKIRRNSLPIGLFPGLVKSFRSLKTILCFPGVKMPFLNKRICPKLSLRIFIMSGLLTGSLRLDSFLNVAELDLCLIIAVDMAPTHSSELCDPSLEYKINSSRWQINLKTPLPTKVSTLQFFNGNMQPHSKPLVLGKMGLTLPWILQYIIISENRTK